MIKKIIILLSFLSIFFGCGFPNYFSYSTSDFEIVNGSLQQNNYSTLYVNPSILSGIQSGTYTAVEGTPFLYFMYTISGNDEKDSVEDNAKKKMNSYFGGSLKSMPNNKSTSLRYSGDSLYYYIMPFRLQGNNTATFYLNGDIDYSDCFDSSSKVKFSFSTKDDPNNSQNFIITLDIYNNNGTVRRSYDLVRLNGDTFPKNFSSGGYKASSESETDYEFDYDDDTSGIISPVLDIYCLASFAFKTYTNRPYAKAAHVAQFTL